VRRPIPSGASIFASESFLKKVGGAPPDLGRRRRSTMAVSSVLAGVRVHNTFVEFVMPDEDSREEGTFLRQRTEPVRGTLKIWADDANDACSDSSTVFSGGGPLLGDDDTTVSGTAVASLQSLPPMEDEEDKQAACFSEGPPESATKHSAFANIVPCPTCGAGVTGMCRFCPCCCSPLELGLVTPPLADASLQQLPPSRGKEEKQAAWRSEGSSERAPHQMADANAVSREQNTTAISPECPSCRTRVDGKYRFCPCCCFPLQKDRATQPAAYMPAAMVPMMVMQQGRQMWFVAPMYGIGCSTWR